MASVGNILTTSPLEALNTTSFVPSKNSLYWISPLYFSFELNFDATKVLSFSRRNYWLSPFAVSIYFLFVYFGPKYMAKRPAFNLREPLKYWNLALAIFSFFGLIRVVPHLLYLIYHSSIAETICTPPLWNFGTGPSALWAILFVYSKYLELIDTVFIVLRKRKLTFLHWYHHATVLIFTWDAFIVEQPPGVYFAAMNYTVHAIMYFYYYYAAARKASPSWGIFVTIIQILQMLAGVSLTIYGIYLVKHYPLMSANKSISTACYVDQRNLWGCMGMYSTYFYLFAAFFNERYISKQANSEKLKIN